MQSDRLALTALPKVTKQGIAGQTYIEHLSCCIYTSDGQLLWVQQSNLHQHRGLVPIDVLVRHFAVANCTIATSGISTTRPVGAIPGNIQSMSSYA